MTTSNTFFLCAFGGFCYISVMQNILFDLDGTLTDPVQGITRCIQHAMSRLGLKAPDSRKLRWCIGPPLVDSFNILLGDHAIMRFEAIRLYRERFCTVGLYENEVYPEVEEVLQKLQSMDYNLFVATSKPRIFARKILEHFGLAKYFKEIYGSELNGRLDDKAALISHILEEQALNPVETLMIGDRKYDVTGAHACGLKCLGTLYGYGTKAELEEAGADFLLPSPLYLFDYLDKEENS